MSPAMVAGGKHPPSAAEGQEGTANCDDPSFWLRKGIGWALRECSRTDPAWVRAEVDLIGDRLSGLSRREATRHLARASCPDPH
jgi:3-methyladenine DNA glycosylase AlkD